MPDPLLLYVADMTGSPPRVLSTCGWDRGERWPDPVDLAATPRLLLDAEDEALDLLDRAAAPVLVVHRRSERDRVHALVVRSDPARERLVATLPTSLPPLGARVWSDLLSGVAEEHGAGAALAAAPLLEPLVEHRVVLGSVARLDAPAPSLRQHVRSWVPGSVFTLTSTTSPAASIEDGPPRLDPVSGGAALTLIRTGEAAPAAVTSAVQEVLTGVGDVLSLVPAPSGADPWDGGAVELVQVVWESVASAVRHAVAVALEPCPWCATPAPAAATCAFCGHAVGAAAGSLPL